jgi:hypothetical protein
MRPAKLSANATISLRAAARDAYLYALPLVEIANVRDRLLGAGVPAGRFYFQHGLATPRDRVVTTPNADTIYASIFIDLRGGPARLILPDLGDRYASLSLMSMFSDNFAILGSRTTGQAGGSFVLVGPDAVAPAGAIRSPTPWVWGLARVVVNGPADAQAALDLLRRFDCEAAPMAGAPARGADRTGSWQTWFAAAAGLMRENPAGALDTRMLQRMAPLGLGGPTFDPAGFTSAQGEEIVAGIGDARQMARAAGFGGRQVGQWIYPAANTGNFFQDYLNRARIAVSGLAALPPSEATYLAAVPPEGRSFDGPGPWRLHFRADELPPVDAFWSLTMYEAEPNGAYFLAENQIDRYTIGDRTPGLRFDQDGSLEIWIARADPGGERTSNWLPAPADGPFMVILRAYLPRQEIVSQTYVPPAVEGL